MAHKSDVAAIFGVCWSHVGLYGAMLGPCQALKTSYIRYSCNFLGMLEPCGAYMGPCWAHVMLLKPAISDIAAIFGVCWGHVGQNGTMLGPCQALKTSYIRYSCNFLGMLEPCGSYMGPCWAYVMLLKPTISDIAAFFGICWSHAGPIETSFIIQILLSPRPSSRDASIKWPDRMKTPKQRQSMLDRPLYRGTPSISIPFPRTPSNRECLYKVA